MPAVLEQPQTRKSLVPRDGEPQPEFAVRFHEAMARRLPDTDARERACRACWDRHCPDDEIEKVAVQQFPAAKFTRVKAVPYFKEHVVRDEDGGAKRYDCDALAEMVELNNDRAIDVGLFAPLSDGHTPTEEQENSGKSDPDVLGYGGCYRLGMIGRKNPCWCIFADEFHHNEDVDRLRRYTRRSPEVWDDGTIDPVAVLGARTPRLDMGMTRFCRDRDGQRVRRYAAAPAANNVYVPGFGRESESQKYSVGDDMALGQEEVAQIIDALMETEQMQWVADQMKQAPKKVEGDDDADDYADDEEMEIEEPGDELDGDDDFPVVDDEGGGEMLSDEEVSEMDEDDRMDYDSMNDDEKMIYAKGFRGRSKPRNGRPHKLSRSNGQTRVERYARERAKSRKTDDLRRQVAAMQNRLQSMDRERRHAERYARLREKESEGYVFDISEEFDEIKDVSEGEWQRHLRRVNRYQRAPVGEGYLPTPELEQPRRSPAAAEKYSRERTARAVKIAQAEKCDYATALEKADKELSA